MTENRAPSTVWLLRKFGTYPNGCVHTYENDLIAISYYEASGGKFIVLPRKDARLLAKRINQCLDSTVKK